MMRDVRLPVEMPLDPGVYDVEIDLIHEGRSWFAGQGMSPWNLQVEVGAD